MGDTGAYRGPGGGHDPPLGLDDDEIDIVYTGLRPGEKLAEELFTDDERTTATRYEQIMVAREPDVRVELDARVDELIEASRRRDWATMDRHLGVLVPGFSMGEFSHLQVASL